MTPNTILCFELFGDYAQFRKFFTNMSPLSFSIPSRTVLTGILGAILGIDKSVNPETFTSDNSFIALRLMNPVKKTKIAHNYLKTSGSMKEMYDFKEHKPTNVEFLKDVRYRLYFAHSDDKLYRKLKSLLEAHQSIYTISLGISGCLAGYEYLGEHTLRGMPPGDELELNSAVPFDSIDEIIFSDSVNLQKIVIPAVMKNDREVVSYEEVLFEQNGASFKAIMKDTSYRVEGLEDIIHGI
jgi:CRISPR-associated protein Cas5h